MSIAWLLPGALAGVGLALLPIAIHLLVRQPARTLPYPSLRFLRETHLASCRRRSIEDLLLVCVRASLIALVAVALAGPVVSTASRQASYAGRVSRAIVLTPDGAERDTVEQLATGAFASTIIARPRLVDGFADAGRWLDQQAASSREIVVVGTVRRGALADADLSVVKPGVGIRFVPATPRSEPDAMLPVLARRGGRLVRINRPMRLTVDSTWAGEGVASPVPDDLVGIVSNPEHGELAAAALRAALVAGVPWVNVNQRVLIVWDGATAAIPAGVTAIHMPVPEPPSRAADAVRDVLAGVSPPRTREPVLVPAEQLAAWTRAPGPPSLDAPLSDEGDRRWVWGLVLVLLVVESWLRRSPAAASDAKVEEARVA